jgi:hypothetical protein
MTHRMSAIMGRGFAPTRPVVALAALAALLAPTATDLTAQAWDVADAASGRVVSLLAGSRIRLLRR